MLAAAITLGQIPLLEFFEFALHRKIIDWLDNMAGLASGFRVDSLLGANQKCQSHTRRCDCRHTETKSHAHGAAFRGGRVPR